MSARTCPGIAHLRRDQLVYELRVRGLTVEGSVPELASRLRAALDKPLKPSGDIFGEVGAFLTNVSSGLDDVECTISFLEGTRPTYKQVCRVQAHLVHFENRLRDLEAVRLEESEVKCRHELLGRVRDLQARMVSFSLDSDGGGSDRESLSGEHGARDNTGSVPRQDPMSLFSKLPNPVMCLVNGISKLGIESLGQVREVLWLLVRFEVQADALQVPHQVILSLLYPLAVGLLSALIGEVLAQRQSLVQLRVRIIQRKLSNRMRLELEREYYWKPQGAAEKLNQYVERVRTAALALDMQVTEAESVSNILEGMRPEDRSRLIFAQRPSNFPQLQQLVNSIEALAFADEQRKPGIDECLVSTQDKGDPPRARNQVTRVRRCFRCGSEEHLVRRCPVARSPRSNS